MDIVDTSRCEVFPISDDALLAYDSSQDEEINRHLAISPNPNYMMTLELLDLQFFADLDGDQPHSLDSYLITSRRILIPEHR